MHTRNVRVGVTGGLALLAALVVAAPAGATAISGHQVPVNGARYKMKGDLLGKWKVTKFRRTDASPVFRGKGTERFNGCLDTDRDRSCDGNVTGKLFFKFRYWARFGDDGQIELGTCAHRVYDGTDGFAGASGFLMMVDTPLASPPFVKTYYEGEIHLTLNSRDPAPGGPGSC
jgi:hypothetical protein